MKDNHIPDGMLRDDIERVARECLKGVVPMSILLEPCAFREAYMARAFHVFAAMKH